MIIFEISILKFSTQCSKYSVTYIKIVVNKDVLREILEPTLKAPINIASTIALCNTVKSINNLMTLK